MAAPDSVTIEDLSGKYVMSQLSDSLDPIFTLQALSWLTRRAISLSTITQDIHHTANPPEIHIAQTLSNGLKPSPEERMLDWQDRSQKNIIFGNVTGKTRYVLLAPTGGEAASGDVEEEEEEAGRTLLMGEKIPVLGSVTPHADDTDRAFLLGQCDHLGKPQPSPHPATSADSISTSWLPRSSDPGSPTKLIQTFAVNTDTPAWGGWTGEQVWGFEMVDVGAEVWERRHVRRIVVRDREGQKVARAKVVYDYIGEVERSN